MKSLRAICGHSEESEKEYKNVFENLKKKLFERGISKSEDSFPGLTACCEKGEYSSTKGYAQKGYDGYLKKELLDLSELEVAMICDGGYSWFGGSSKIDENGRFHVTIYID
jgi:hypothetical protein